MNLSVGFLTPINERVQNRAARHAHAERPPRQALYIARTGLVSAVWGAGMGFAADILGAARVASVRVYSIIHWCKYGTPPQR